MGDKIMIGSPRYQRFIPSQVLERPFRIYSVVPVGPCKTSRGSYLKAEDLKISAHTLSNKPLTLNHNFGAVLPYPDNSTLEFYFDPRFHTIQGMIKISDRGVINKIECGGLKGLSVEYYSNLCLHTNTEKDIRFSGLSLTFGNHTPSYSQTQIRRVY